MLSCKDISFKHLSSGGGGSHQVQYRHFHHTLIEICRPVLDDLYGHDLLRLQVLAFDYLTECSLTEDIEDEVPIPAKAKISNVLTVLSESHVLVACLL